MTELLLRAPEEQRHNLAEGTSRLAVMRAGTQKANQSVPPLQFIVRGGPACRDYFSELSNNIDWSAVTDNYAIVVEPNKKKIGLQLAIRFC